MDMKTEVKIVDFESLRALVTVTIDGIELRGFKVIDQGDNKPWIAPPSREILRDGRKEFFDIVRIKDKERKKVFNGEILAAYRKAAGISRPVKEEV